MGAKPGVRAVEAADHLWQLSQPGHQHAGSRQGAGALKRQMTRPPRKGGRAEYDDEKIGVIVAEAQLLGVVTALSLSDLKPTRRKSERNIALTTPVDGLENKIPLRIRNIEPTVAVGGMMPLRYSG
ncbi:hypothetical protein [Aurantimonas sp. NFXS3]|uniref:hypothetical protein n=1 Tax=Aurantimonas sp. NFXS3 TaxID=2818434 RepID=UPI003B8CE254